ncbi:hypothetical protein MG290_10065 [Flavobacterium sp. CBA20B-1]|uniref:hypothetical protein n=1 Tax=unclassified Flavobacterium TaxID=196869 RepID=UPI0022252625|nr:MULTISPECIES: hypothetical protein [unclassified Flavobacterium]WCM41301.1 hypothetical protein MG290_10065 [Flavobacterium sp. CBA20B-1]
MKPIPHTRYEFIGNHLNFFYNKTQEYVKDLIPSTKSYTVDLQLLIKKFDAHTLHKIRLIGIISNSEKRNTQLIALKNQLEQLLKTLQFIQLSYLQLAENRFSRKNMPLHFQHPSQEKQNHPFENWDYLLQVVNCYYAELLSKKLSNLS